MTRIFDGKTLDGWIQEPLSVTSFSSGDITPALVVKITAKADPISAFLNEKLDDASKTALAANSSPTEVSKDLKSALSKCLTSIVQGPALSEHVQFQGIVLRRETHELLNKNPQGKELARLNRALLEDAYRDELSPTPSAGWIVKDGAIVSLGAGRGVIYTKQSFGRYRVIFDVRHVWGKPDHRAGVLVFCTEPNAGEKPMDALGGIQFQVPMGGSWDYRRGYNNGGKGLFTRLIKPTFNEKEWSRCEILVDPASGTARMAVSQPPGSKAVEVLDFKDPSAGQNGPFALQMHNKGLFDEYANIAVELDPKGDELITMNQ
jgi:hypothetical protein